jgi:hypothetical protein
MTPFRDLREALASAFAKVGADAKIWVMPYAGSTVPRCCTTNKAVKVRIPKKER